MMSEFAWPSDTVKDRG